MEASLFSDIVFGPMKSRRFGSSLGVNVLPTKAKFCNFDCAYCELGWTNYNKEDIQMPKPSEVVTELIRKVELLIERGTTIDNITFAGNGEPTLHPQFEEIIEDVLLVRDVYLPESKVSVLTNATMLHREPIRKALMAVDTCMFKIDAGTQKLFEEVNRPQGHISLQNIEDQIKGFPGKTIVQSMFVRGTVHGQQIDNTTPEAIESWRDSLNRVNPDEVVIYSLDRPTPEAGLAKLEVEELNQIASFLNGVDYKVNVY